MHGDMEGEYAKNPDIVRLVRKHYHAAAKPSLVWFNEEDSISPAIAETKIDTNSKPFYLSLHVRRGDIVGPQSRTEANITNAGVGPHFANAFAVNCMPIHKHCPAGYASCVVCDVQGKCHPVY